MAEKDTDPVKQVAEQVAAQIAALGGNAELALPSVNGTFTIAVRMGKDVYTVTITIPADKAKPYGVKVEQTRDPEDEELDPVTTEFVNFSYTESDNWNAVLNLPALGPVEKFSVVLGEVPKKPALTKATPAAAD